MKWFLHAKIHRATVTEANVDYVGSITIDSALMEKAGILEYEKVAVWDVTNGERLETYAVAGENGLGEVCMNGAAAKKIRRGDKVIIAAFELSEKPVKPKMILVDGKNRFVKYM
ncbi:aspartate 1-decarboxylase [Candidatus Woesearchaeota archaeon CG10_big_fil_rev_8_21_14_0_10_44_13]|nr:MAG: aspartate 1-decarboxylase [Candidatus Woesearchaeota archaeon CG10_big_fil_rev_8_21_14_0_10_44_13]